MRKPGKRRLTATGQDNLYMFKSTLFQWERFYNSYIANTPKIRESKKGRHHNGKKKENKQRPTKHYTENFKSTNTNLTKTVGERMCSAPLVAPVMLL